MSAARFFLSVRLHSPVMLAGLAAVVLAGGVQIVWDPRTGRDAVSTLLTLQMFASSSGFAIPARRGHYDTVLTGGASRGSVIAAHLAHSVAPGLAGWLALGVIERVCGGGAVWSTGSLVAWLLLSAGGWALSVPLPRLSGGVIWLVLLLVGIGWPSAWRADLLAVAAGGGSTWTRMVIYALSPLVLAGRSLSAGEWLAVAPVAAVIGGLVLAAWQYALRIDVALEAAQ